MILHSICTLKYEYAFFAHHRHSGFYMYVPIGKKLRLIQLYMLKYQHKIDHTHIIMWMIRNTTNSDQETDGSFC